MERQRGGKTMMRGPRTIFILLIPIFLSGCGIIYTNVRLPRAYRSATPGEVHSDKSDKIVTGTACNHSLLFVFAWGDGGYAGATRDALREDPGAILYDVKADTQLKSFLGLYARVCTVVTGKVSKP
jgi:hypothetical protein